MLNDTVAINEHWVRLTPNLFRPRGTDVDPRPSSYALNNQTFDTRREPAVLVQLSRIRSRFPPRISVPAIPVGNTPPADCGD